MSTCEGGIEKNRQASHIKTGPRWVASCVSLGRLKTPIEFLRPTGIGLGVIASEASTITDEMFLAAARSLADQVTTIYPPLSSIRAVSKAIAVDVAEKAFEQGVAGLVRPDALAEHVESLMYQPVYDRDK